MIKNLDNKNLKTSSWYGSLSNNIENNEFERINRGYNYNEEVDSYCDEKFPWFLYWEIVWVILNSNFDKGDKILDLGGSSSLFSYYLSSKGFDVTTIDISKELVDNANITAESMSWSLKNYVMDMKKINLNDKFDHITSICVFEHIPMFERIEINKKIRNLLVEGGNFSITFDYRNPSNLARISSPNDIIEQFVKPSGLFMRNNEQFYEDKKNYLLHPFYYKKKKWLYKLKAIKNKEFPLSQLFKGKKENDYTFGALFLTKKDEQ